MTIRRLGTALAITTLCVACAHGEMIPGDGNGTPSTPTGGASSKPGGTGGGASTTPQTGGGAPSTQATSVGTSGGSGKTTTTSGGSGSTSTPVGTGGSGTPATTKPPTTATGCDSSTEELIITQPAKEQGYGGATKITAAPGKTVPAATLLFKFCFGLIGSTVPSFDEASIKQNITVYNANIGNIGVAPYNISMTSAVKVTAETVDAANKKYCIVFDFSGATDIDQVQMTNGSDGAGGAGGQTPQVPLLSLDWDMKADILGNGNMLDVRAGSEPKLIATNGDAIAACMNAP